MSYEKDVRWTLDELHEERRAMDEELAQVRGRYEPRITELRDRLEEETRKLLADPERHDVGGVIGGGPADEPKPKRKRRQKEEPKKCEKCGAPPEVYRAAGVFCCDCFVEHSKELDREEAKREGRKVYDFTDDEGVTVGYCVDCDRPAGSPPAGCGNPAAHKPAQAGDLELPL